MKKKLLLCLVTSLLMIGVTSCGGDTSTPTTKEPDPSTEPTTEPENGTEPEENQKKNFTGVSFNSKTITYDGEAHTIEVEGAPEGSTITYSGNGPFINVGEYNIQATISKEGYNDLPLNAKLTIINAELKGISIQDLSIDYDGNSHSIEVKGNIPSNATISYSSDVNGITNSATNAGTYNVTAVISVPNYNTLTLSAKLTIKNAELSGITFKDASVEYDGNSHSIVIEGNIPSNATVTYSSDVDGITNSAAEIGTYNITAVISAPNFNNLTLTAQLKITSNDDERALCVSGSTLFFENAIHDNKLYAYNFSDQKLAKVSNDVAQDIIPDGNNKAMFVSKTSLTSSIKTASYDTETDSTTYSSLLNKYGRYIQRESDTIIYYCVNGLTNDKSGIYKADLSGDEPVITCLSVGKAKYLQLSGAKLYFADGANDNKLSSISTSGNNQTRTLVQDEKINNLTCYNGVLFYTVNETLGDYIARYNISSGVRRKLTQDAGVNLTLVDGELYYINVDKLTTSFKGNGIYKVDANPSSDNQSSGTKVIDGSEYGVCSLTSYGKDLLYYDVNGYKLMDYSTTNQTSKNLLEGFVAPEDPTPTSFGSQVETTNGIIYYLDIYDDKTLHSYNPSTKMNYRLTSEKVDNFAIVGDYIYYNMVSYGVNNDTYRMSLKVSEAPELINTYDSDNLVSDGNYIYYAEKNASGARTAIHKADMDGSNDVIIFDYAADNLVLDNGTLYFCAKPNAVQTIMKIENVSSVTSAQEKVCVNDDYACDVFTIDNGVIYFRQNYGTLYKYHRLAKMNVDGSGYTEMVTASTDPTEILVSGNYVYYVNSADSANDYDLYRIGIDGTEGEQEELTSDMYASSICLLDDKVYFINYYMGGTLGDSHLYTVNITGGEITQID